MDRHPRHVSLRQRGPDGGGGVPHRGSGRRAERLEDRRCPAVPRLSRRPGAGHPGDGNGAAEAAGLCPGGRSGRAGPRGDHRCHRAERRRAGGGAPASAPARYPGAAPPRRRGLDDSPRPPGGPAVQRGEAGHALEGAPDLLLPQLHLRACLSHRALPRPSAGAHAARRLRAALEAGGGGRCADGAVRADAPLHRPGDVRRARAGGRGVADAARRALPSPCLAQSGAAHRLVGADHPHRAPHLPHVSLDARRSRGGGEPPGAARGGTGRNVPGRANR